MQTFLPYPNFEASARSLDRLRLGKQRVEARQLLTPRGWANHPAARMWRGYEASLAEYGDVMITEWVCRGYRNTMPLLASDRAHESPRPPWLGDPAFHASHRSNLLRKDPIYYGRFGWIEPANLPYAWPKDFV